MVEGLERAEKALKRVIIRGGLDIGLLGCGWSKLLGRFQADMILPNGYATFCRCGISLGFSLARSYAIYL